MDSAFGAIGPGVLVNGVAGTDQRDIGAFTGIQRLANVASAEAGRSVIVVEIGWQQIWMARKHRPQQRQNSLV